MSTNGNGHRLSQDLETLAKVLRQGGISHAEMRCIELEDRLEMVTQDLIRMRCERDVLRQILAEATKHA